MSFVNNLLEFCYVSLVENLNARPYFFSKKKRILNIKPKLRLLIIIIIFYLNDNQYKHISLNDFKHQHYV